jgi:hypothetical protein
LRDGCGNRVGTAARRAATLAICRIAGEGFGLQPLRDQDGNSEALRRAGLRYLRYPQPFRK